MYSSNIDDLVLPNGFDISIVAVGLDSPRQLTETKSGHVIVGSKKGSEIIALIDNNNDGYFEERAIVAENLQNPTGVVFHKDDLYFAEIDTVWVIRDIDLWINSKTSELPEKAIYMSNLPSETWHGFKYIDFGPDDNLYIPVGVPCNICIEPQTKDKRFAAIHKYENGELITVADGVRNSVGFDWHPITKKMYFSDNGRDWLGDDSPSCELNIIEEEGSFFGYPYKHAKNVIDPEFGHLIPTLQKKIVDPINNDSKGFSFAFVNNALKPFFFPASVAAAVAFVVAKSAPPPLGCDRRPCSPRPSQSCHPTLVSQARNIHMSAQSTASTQCSRTC